MKLSLLYESPETQFTTSKGSIYVVRGNTTIRKRFSGEGYSQSTFTAYLPSLHYSQDVLDKYNSLKSTTGMSDTPVIIRGGKSGKLFIITVKSNGEVRIIQEIAFEPQPRIGTVPIELWQTDNNCQFHIGHPIISIGKEPVQVPAPLDGANLGPK